MSSVKELKGGLSSQNNGAVLEIARKKLVGHRKMSLDFLKTDMEDKQKEEDGRIDRKALAEHVDDIADKTFKWILDVARPFLRKLDQDVQDIGREVLDDTSEDSEESNAEQQRNYEERIELLLSFSPENDKDIRDELELHPERKRFFERMFRRINDVARIALLADDLRHAEEKDYLEHLLEVSKNGEGKRVFVKTKDLFGFKVFGQWYELSEDVFGHYNDFAYEKLAEAASARSRELATAHNTELQKQKQEVSAKTETDVSAEQLLFGNPRDVNEKTALLSWNFQGHQNALRLERSGDRLYVVSAIGKPNEALEKAQDELDDPFVLLNYILDNDREHLCHGKMEDGKTKYDFGGFVKRELFALVCWVRTAAGECVPNRLLPGDETRTPKTNGNGATNGHSNGNGKQVALVDDDGTEDVDPETFYFRTVNGGAGTLRVNLPEGFVLHLDEAKDEDQELLAPERDVRTTQPVMVKIRRLIVDGMPKIILDDCDNVAVMQELQINGIPGVNWIETGKKGWVGLPTPLPGILSFRYKVACESGEIKPNTKH